jgi:Brp/Blh family beta-carotene 15,15'-monooxygenase
MIARALAWGWGLLLGAAAAASSFGSLTVQLTFAVGAIGVIGMAHGASDLAVVEPRQRPLFVALYVFVGAVCLWWWVVDPAIALPAFLIASAIHFGVEDAPADRPLERVARGTSLVATPATFHATNLTDLLRLGGTSTNVLPAMVSAMTLSGAIAAAYLIVRASQRHDLRLLIGTAALIVLPPLVGFSVGFLVLHAEPQTFERRTQIGCATTGSYLRATAPILVAAILLATITGMLLLRADPSGVRPLFAGIAALAVPHLIVTPLFGHLQRRIDPTSSRLQCSG